MEGNRQHSGVFSSFSTVAAQEASGLPFGSARVLVGEYPHCCGIGEVLLHAILCGVVVQIPNEQDFALPRLCVQTKN